jgi:hypothetical protein
MLIFWKAVAVHLIDKNCKACRLQCIQKCKDVEDTWNCEARADFSAVKIARVLKARGLIDHKLSGRNVPEI